MPPISGAGVALGSRHDGTIMMDEDAGTKIAEGDTE
jgi:hypothetical protein